MTTNIRNRRSTSPSAVATGTILSDSPCSSAFAAGAARSNAPRKYPATSTVKHPMTSVCESSASKSMAKRSATRSRNTASAEANSPPNTTSSGKAAMPTHEPRSGRDYPGGADEGVEAPRHGAQQHVRRDSRQGGCAQDVEAEPGLGAHRAHPAAASGKPPKRRSRARNSATAAASGAAPKSGHMVGVKYSSAYAHSHSRKSDTRCSPPVRTRRSTSGRSAAAPIAQREE